MRNLATVAALAAAIALSGCSFNFQVGGDSVSTADLEEQISTQLAAQVGVEPDEVKCEDELPAKEGAKVECVLTHEGISFPVYVDATSVEDGTVSFDIEVGEEPIQ